MNCISHGLRHCDSERMHKRDHSTLTSGSDRPAGPTRMATLQEISHCTVVGKSSKFIALSATQVVAPLFLHYTRCACQHRYRIGQVHRLPSGSDGVRVVRVAYLLTPVCARLHRQGRRPALCSLLHAVTRFCRRSARSYGRPMHRGLTGGRWKGDRLTCCRWTLLHMPWRTWIPA